MDIKYHAQFLLDKERGKSSAKLRFRIKWEGNIVAFNLGYRVDVEKWSAETQRCKANTTHGDKKVSASIINRKIQQFEQACETVFKKFEIKNSIPDADQYRDFFNEEIGKKPKVNSEKSFFDVFDTFVEEETKNAHWKERTIQKMNTLKNKLVEFNPNLKFEDLDEQGFLSFQFFLESKNYKNSTVLKEFKSLKWFLRWAKRKNFQPNPYFEIYQPKLKNIPKKVIFLTQDELKKLREYAIPDSKRYLERIRDVFLFQCFTGLRYSDVYNLRKSNIRDGLIEITTIKTSDNLTIELNTHSRNILNKYKDEGFPGNKALPVISNQKMNDYLKELAELAEIDEPVVQTFYKGSKRIDEVLPKFVLIGTHCGRRTFICNALSLGIPPQVVMKWTGHSDYSAMKPYIDIADQIKASAMEKFDAI